jgi:hypothetical protein
MHSSSTQEQYLPCQGAVPSLTDERGVCRKWREDNRVSEHEAVRELADLAVRSGQTSWEGIRMLPRIGHPDWGFHPDTLDEEHNRPPVLVVSARQDRMAPEVHQRYLVEQYKNARMGMNFSLGDGCRAQPDQQKGRPRASYTCIKKS